MSGDHILLLPIFFIHFYEQQQQQTRKIVLFLDKLEADASRSRESLTPPSLKPAYKIEINHDEDSGERILLNDNSGDEKFFNSPAFVFHFHFSQHGKEGKKLSLWTLMI